MVGIHTYVHDNMFTMYPPSEDPELEGEIKYCFYAKNEGIETHRPNHGDLKPPEGTVIIFTDVAVHIFLGGAGRADTPEANDFIKVSDRGEPTDYLFKIPNGDIENVKATSGTFRGRIKLDMSEEHEIAFDDGSSWAFSSIHLLVNNDSYEKNDFEGIKDLILPYW